MSNESYKLSNNNNVTRLTPDYSDSLKTFQNSNPFAYGDKWLSKDYNADNYLNMVPDYLLSNNPTSYDTGKFGEDQFVGSTIPDLYKDYANQETSSVLPEALVLNAKNVNTNNPYTLSNAPATRLSVSSATQNPNNSSVLSYADKAIQQIALKNKLQSGEEQPEESAANTLQEAAKKLSRRLLKKQSREQLTNGPIRISAFARGYESDPNTTDKFKQFINAFKGTLANDGVMSISEARNMLKLKDNPYILTDPKTMSNIRRSLNAVQKGANGIYLAAYNGDLEALKIHNELLPQISNGSINTVDEINNWLNENKILNGYLRHLAVNKIGSNLITQYNVGTRAGSAWSGINENWRNKGNEAGRAAWIDENGNKRKAAMTTGLDWAGNYNDTIADNNYYFNDPYKRTRKQYNDELAFYNNKMEEYRRDANGLFNPANNYSQSDFAKIFKDQTGDASVFGKTGDYAITSEDMNDLMARLRGIYDSNPVLAQNMIAYLRKNASSWFKSNGLGNTWSNGLSIDENNNELLRRNLFDLMHKDDGDNKPEFNRNSNFVFFKNGGIMKALQGLKMDPKMKMKIAAAYMSLMLKQKEKDPNKIALLVATKLKGMKEEELNQIVAQVLNEVSKNNQIGEAIALEMKGEIVLSIIPDDLQTHYAKHGGYLNKIHSLNTGCPYGQEPLYFKKGNKICKKCADKQAIKQTKNYYE